MSRECSEQVGRFMRREDEAWCDGFIEAHNASACAVDGLRLVIDELEDHIDMLTLELDAARKKIAVLTKVSDMLVEITREGR